MPSAHKEQNIEDLRVYFRQLLQSLEQPLEGADVLARKSDGLFVYAELAADRIEDDPSCLGDLDAFPEGLGAFYETQMRRIVPSLDIALEGVEVSRLRK